MTLEEVKKAYTDTFSLPDDRVLDLVFAVILNMYVKTDPIWLLLVGSPSSGKSELIQAFYKVPKVFEISDITENSFLSGARTSGEASFLKKMGAFGTIAMKDFTSVLSYRPEKREVILSQMRQIYDGHMTKKTGTDTDSSWTGKVNLIGGVTEDIYIKGEESASMGQRCILYVLPKQNRRAMVDAARKSRKSEPISVKRARIQEFFANFVSEKLEELPTEGQLPSISDEASEQLILLADFATLARTPVTRDRFTRDITFVHSPEMPVRVTEQLHTFAEMIQFLYGGELPRAALEPLWAISFDSIPKIRRQALFLMAQYDRITTKGAAIRLNLSTMTLRRTLEDLNAINIVRRIATQQTQRDYWELSPEYKELIQTHAGVVFEGGTLEVPAGEEDQDEGQAFEEEKRTTEAFEKM